MPADPRPGDRSGRLATQSSPQRRSAARTAVVWDALRAVLDQTGRPVSVVDIGGGTGGFAVRVAELGHQVLVIDPSPDALATLARRADESGVADRITGRQGDLDSLADLVHAHREAGAAGGAAATDGTGAGDGTGKGPAVDVVVCHGVLDIVEDPAAALASLAGVLRPGGTLSLLVNQRHAAVVARAMAGHFQQARALLDPAGAAGPTDPADEPATGQAPGASEAGPHRRFTAEELSAALDRAGFDVATMHAVRVFVDLVPSSLVDLEPGAAQALVELERAVATRPEYLALATQVHALAVRR